MITLFNDNWQFSELSFSSEAMYKDGKPVLFNPQSFFNNTKNADYLPVKLPHDWQIYHVKDLYRNSVGCYKKTLTLTEEEITNRHLALRFEGVYMNSAVWVNDKLAGEWKYGYSTFEFDISSLVKPGNNEILVIAVYQNCNTRWYSGAGIFRDVYLINTPRTFIAPDGTYFVIRSVDTDLKKWDCHFSTEICTDSIVADDDVVPFYIKTTITDRKGKLLYQTAYPSSPDAITIEETEYLHKNVPATKDWNFFKTNEHFEIENPVLWDIDNPYLYTVTTELFSSGHDLLDSCTQNCGFKTATFTTDSGFFLNGRHVKIQGACHHHDLGCLGSAFDKNALKRQFLKLKEMGVNAVRCSHNPPPKAWLDLCDELGLLVDNEAFDMWEKPKTQFDYGNYFNDWCERDVVNWVRKDRNHPSLIMWSVGNEIYDTHMGNGLEITKKLYSYVQKNDPEKNAQITIASNYMMTDGACNCAQEIDTVGYNYLERLYNEHHAKYPHWKIYGSETGSTVQSRGIYHFPDTLKLVTFSDGQCSTLGNCTTTWGCANTQTVIANDRDCPFSAGQFIWTGWDYIGEPTPYHSKNSYFGQIDTAGFPKDTFFLYKSEWAGFAEPKTGTPTGTGTVGKKTEPFVHLLPYWDWNEGQLIDVKAYTNCNSVELFFNGKSLGRQQIDHTRGLKPFGQWQLEYHKGEIKAVAYYDDGTEATSETKRSFGDPAKIIIKPEEFKLDNSNTSNNSNTADTSSSQTTTQLGDLLFIDFMLADKDGTLVENARNYITFNVTGDAELVGMDNGDSTDYEEYKSDSSNSHTRKLFANRLLAVIRAKKHGRQGLPSFVVTAASQGLPTVSLKYDGKEWKEAAPYLATKPMIDYVPVRKIELIAEETGANADTKNTATTQDTGNTKNSVIAQNTAGSTSLKGLILSKQNPEVRVTAKVYPENATDKEILWNPVLKECVASDNIQVCETDNTNTGAVKATDTYNTHTDAVDAADTTTQTKLIRAIGDGECILRCTAKNGSELDEVISDLNFTVEGIGNPKLNPYKLIEACRFTGCDESKGKPRVSLESGIANRGIGPTWISFDKVDFGPDGADTIHIPIFSFETELPIEVWDGKPPLGTTYEGTNTTATADSNTASSANAECFGRFIYKHESIYNTFSENVFTLPKRLFGVHTIAITMLHEYEFKGFYFDKTPKAYAKLRALDASVIVGDTFTKTAAAVEGIGNNVNLDFENMDFGTEPTTKLTIYGKSNTDNNTINLKFFDDDGSSTTQVIEFTRGSGKTKATGATESSGNDSNGYEEKTFTISPVSGKKKVSFVFLPGCNFDFEWFRFEK